MSILQKKKQLHASEFKEVSVMINLRNTRMCKHISILFVLAIVLISVTNCDEEDARKRCESECRSTYDACIANANSEIDKRQCETELSQCSGNCMSISLNSVGPGAVETSKSSEIDSTMILTDSSVSLESDKTNTDELLGE